MKHDLYTLPVRHMHQTQKYKKQHATAITVQKV